MTNASKNQIFFLLLVIGTTALVITTILMKLVITTVIIMVLRADISLNIVVGTLLINGTTLNDTTHNNRASAI